MAKKKKRGGPYLAAAFFCDQVVEAKDGALSPIRITDQIQVLIPANMPADFPSKEKRLSIAMAGLLSFKTGYARPGEYTVQVIMESPSGKIGRMHKQKIQLSDPPHGGGNLIMRNTIGIYKGGLFWFNVYLNEKLMARIPLSITYKRQEPTPETASAPASADSAPASPANGSAPKKVARRRKR